MTGKLTDCCFELARQQKAQRQITGPAESAALSAIILTMAILRVVFRHAALCSAGICRHLP
ncbi:hypothetical protein KCP77_21810 [Salmonella enterica subsp. enterica]|nr:hypothetical protein KCP77_21810 [Salmonella enterica subsp. enterica]